ncbi:sensor histidine kinase [Paenibacillus sp. BAC0078]
MTNKLRKKWKSVFGKTRGTDLLRRTQRKLTIQYSAVLITFLILFVSTVYGLLHYLLINEQKQQLETWLVQKAGSMRGDGEYGGDKNRLPGPPKEGASDDTSARAGGISGIFVDRDGELLTPDLPFSLSVNQISAFLKGLEPAGEETVYRTVRYSESDNSNTGQKDLSGQLLIAGKTLFHDGQAIGILYAVKDASALFRLLQWLLVILIVIALLFFGLAIFLSYKMSSKAMVPVRRSFTRQQEFVGDASHELRTPLSVLLSSIDTLEMEGVTDNHPFARKVLDNMKDEARRMIRLSDGLLTLARSDSDAATLQMAPFNLVETASRLVRSLQPIAAAKQIPLHVHAAETLMMNGDEARVSQLLVILLDNAIKYTPEGGNVNLTISRSEGRSRKLIIEVKDSGIGIAPEDLPRIFERFYRVDKSRARELGGYGIGLSIAKWIAEAHEGRITAASVVGEGSIFTVEIPSAIEF